MSSYCLTFRHNSGIIDFLRQSEKNMTAGKMITLVLTESELELIYDQLNCVELYDDSDENLELVSSINDKVFNLTSK